VLVLSRQANQLATGLVVLFLGLGLTSLFGAAYVRESINAFHPIAIPGLSSIPWLGEIFFDIQVDNAVAEIQRLVKAAR